MPVSIPPEILNLIVEQHREDLKQLFSCSLVSKPWLQATRYYLFGEIILYLGGPYEARFLALLGHPLCTFATSVRKFWILPAQERELSKQVNENIAQLAKLTSVRTLRIHRQKMIPPQTLSVLATTFKGVTTLLMAVRFPAFASAVQFMGSFPLLEEVFFEPVRTQPGDFPSGIQMPARLRSVHLHSLCGHERWFADNRVPTLSTLSIENIRPLDDIPRLNEILEIFSTDLRHLTLRFASKTGDFDVQVNLQHNTQLRALEIDLSMLTRRHVLPVISSLRAPHVETIVWRNRRVFNLSADLWAGLDALLADRDAFGMLRSFTIMAKTAACNPRLLMPLCDALGILCGEEDIAAAF
ncbi:hypothetical protein DFH07DRAFT_1061042 [Mycena maculata]|uniref:F-box domain-containing protein n=1 Tax=Mycena maculata TaxID=230809 RepID=A0AAD7ND71_9AGAR|nr:hypothetical protein DFH07DRAFT_1061042 [Mycena maculata]